MCMLRMHVLCKLGVSGSWFQSVEGLLSEGENKAYLVCQYCVLLYMYLYIS